MTDICNPANYPPQEFFQQHKLSPVGPPGYEYEYTRCFLIYAVAGAGGIIADLDIRMVAVLEPDDAGTKRANARWEEQLDKLKLLTPPAPLLRTPLDFSVQFRTRVLLRLFGDFWRFSSSVAAVTTKHPFGKQYFDLRSHEVAPSKHDVRCVSFFTDAPCHQSHKMRHGFSLNVELLAPTGDVLPITIDPDIENKGGIGPLVEGEEWEQVRSSMRSAETA